MGAIKTRHKTRNHMTQSTSYLLQRRPYTHYQKLEFSFIFLFCAWLIISVFWGEHVLTHNGLGQDGMEYADIARDFPNFLLNHELSQYRFQRILPSGIVYAMAWLSQISLAPPQNVVLLFSIYNLILLLLAVGLWYQIANKLQWTPAIRLISFAGLFLNFAIFKVALFNPVLTDPSAFFVGMLLVYYFLEDKYIKLLLATFFGAFIFPTFLVLGLLLFTFPLQQFTSTHELQYSRLSIVIANIMGLIAATAAILLYLSYGPTNKTLPFWDSPLGLVLGAVGLFLYVVIGSIPLLNMKFKIKKYLHPIRITTAISIFLLLKIFIFFMSNGTAGDLSTDTFVKAIFIRALAFPVIFFVSHVIYFGPIILLIAFFWKEFVTLIQTRGLGVIGATVLIFLLSLNSESRQLINFFPFIIIMFIEMIKHQKFSNRFLATFILLSVFISKIWMLCNSTLAFPPHYRWTAMSFGPWMSAQMYVINCFAVIAITFIMYKLLKKYKHNS